MDKISEGQVIVGSDDRKIGRVTGEENGFVLVQTGHVFKATHAMPKEFVHEIDGELRATIARAIVDGSPAIGEGWNAEDVLVYYGIGDSPVLEAGLDDAEIGFTPEDAGIDEARVAQGDDGSWSPVLPRKD